METELGFELEVAGDNLTGTALRHEGAICLLAAFPADTGGADNG